MKTISGSQVHNDFNSIVRRCNHPMVQSLFDDACNTALELDNWVYYGGDAAGAQSLIDKYYKILATAKSLR